MMKLPSPERVQLPDSRVFFAKYKRVKRNMLLPNVRIQKTYGPRQRRGGGIPRRGQRGRGFKTKVRSAIRKSGNLVNRIYEIGRKASKNRAVKRLVIIWCVKG